MLRVVLLAITACTQPDDGIRETSLAGLGQVSLDIWVGDSVVDVQVHYPGACAQLGSDFVADIDGTAIYAFGGGFEDVCSAPTTGQPCIEQPPACAEPELTVADIPHDDPAVLRFGDVSRTIECDLGSDLVPRTLTRVPDGSWDAAAGDTITARWSPGGDVPRFGLEVELDAAVGIPALPSTTDTDVVTFQIPPKTSVFPHVLSVSASDTQVSDTKCHGVVASRSHSYNIDEHFMVH